MIVAKSMEVRGNFKSWCGQVADGEIVQIARPGNSYVYLIGQGTYDKFTMHRRMEAYTSYLFGKDKITNLKRLSEIENLSDNWNNNGAEKIPVSVIKSVRKLLMTIEFQPEIFPTACDALQLEWENNKDEYLEMEILENSVNVFRIDSDGNELQKNIKFDTETINKMVREFYDRAV
ncbi:MAG: hypothetical protein KBS79_04130 [Lachnospiraceae bacterium]|nr:hypothetical protein [Candidatus Minthocola equi]